MVITSVQQFLDYWTSVRGRTRRVVECIPPERIEWTHRAGAFTLGDLVRHLATIERYMYAETVAGRPSSYPGCGRDLADGYEHVLAYFDRLDAEAREIIGVLSDTDLQRKCRTPAGTAITTWKWLRAMVEHEVHHRGQIYLMLGILQVPTPPLYGLTSEEVRERSTRAPSIGAE
ncbi:MAG TPA: DinB family protein [Gemmatimonadales bacterium]|nr:DinB family protein [Gemmatimonadales bacterium]